MKNNIEIRRKFHDLRSKWNDMIFFNNFHNLNKAQGQLHIKSWRQIILSTHVRQTSPRRVHTCLWFNFEPSKGELWEHALNAWRCVLLPQSSTSQKMSHVTHLSETLKWAKLDNQLVKTSKPIRKLPVSKACHYLQLLPRERSPATPSGMKPFRIQWKVQVAIIS